MLVGAIYDRQFDLEQQVLAGGSNSNPVVRLV